MNQRHLKAGLLALLLGAASSATAQWVELEIEDEQVRTSGDTYYVDPEIRAVGSWLRVHTMRNYANPDRAGNRSDSMLCEVNCQNRTLRAISGAFYQHAMGTGEFGVWKRQTPWVHPGPKSALESVLQFVCDRAERTERP